MMGKVDSSDSGVVKRGGDLHERSVRAAERMSDSSIAKASQKNALGEIFSELSKERSQFI